MPPRCGKSGQAMIETIIVMVFLIIAFFSVTQFADNFRARLVADYAAGRCARSRAIGMNDFMLLKTARLATMSIAGKNLLPAYTDGNLSARQLIGRAGNYLATTSSAQTQGILDFELWRNNRTRVHTVLGGRMITAIVEQDRPQFFDLARFLRLEENNPEKTDESLARIKASHAMEVHYTDYLDQ